MSDRARGPQDQLFKDVGGQRPERQQPAASEAGGRCARPFRDWEPDQGALLPRYLRDELGADHLACFFLDLRKTLDFGPILSSYSSDRGQPAYHPVMMTLLLMYAYAMGVVSSRKIARLCVTDLAFRYLSGGARPDHDTICAFRVRHLEAFEVLFQQTVQVAQSLGLVRLGHVAIDGSKIEANASKHKAMSYEYMDDASTRLRQQIRRLLEEAEAIDAEEDRRFGKGKRGDELPADLADPAKRLERMKQARAELEAAKKRELAKDKKRRLNKIKEAKAELEKEARERAEKEGKAPAEAKPEPKAQRNFTDPESRLMARNKTTFVQGYNAQIAVDAGSQIVVAQAVLQTTRDINQLAPMLEQVHANTGQLPAQVSADTGYLCEADIREVERQGVEVFVPAGRQKHDLPQEAPRGRTPSGLSFVQRMARKLLTKRGRAAYAKRKVTAEPAFGQMKNRGFRRFSMRGVTKVRGEFALVSAVHNLLKLRVLAFPALVPA